MAEGSSRRGPLRGHPAHPAPGARAGPARASLKWAILAAFTLGCLGVAALLGWYGVAGIGRTVLAALWTVPIMALIQAVQLYFAGCGWRVVIPAPPRPTRLRFLWLRWIRDAVNALLPVAQVGGELAAARLMIRDGVQPGIAGASATADLTLEFLSQILVIMLALALLLAVRPDQQVIEWIAVGLGTAVVAVAGFIAAQRLGLLRLVEAGIARLAAFLPALSLGNADGLHDALMRIHSDWRRLLVATAYHVVAWALGAAEVWVVLAALGHPVGLEQAFVIDALSQAARSAGFAVPAGLTVQEGGLILVAGLFDVPPDTALALAMLKRLRELVVSLPGLLAWQLAEGVRLAALLGRLHIGAPAAPNPPTPSPARVPRQCLGRDR